MKYLTHLIALGLGIIIGFGIRSCNVEPCPETKVGIETRIDTVYLKSAIVKPSYKPKPNKVKPADTNLNTPAVYFYQDSLIDSNLAIYITDTAAGEILSRGIKYNLKVPLQIKETVTITKEVEKPVLQSGLFIGVEIGANPTVRNFRIVPEIEYLTKKGYAYSYSYDVLNSVHSVGVKRKIKL